MIDNKVEIELPAAVLAGWQEIVDTLTAIVKVPVALIMRFGDPHIEVLVSSKNPGNPYHPGDKEVLMGSGLYCETVLKTQAKLLVPDALADSSWRSNPDVKHNLISYLGFPILLPDKRPFGTICVLDNKANEYSESFEKLMGQLRNLIELNLETIYINQSLGDKNRRLTDYLMELQGFRGLVPICASCKSIRDAQGHWHPIEHYLIKHPIADFTHGYCPACTNKLYPELKE
jgi:GAF domain-containing protein